MKETPPEHLETLLHCEGNCVLAQVAQRGKGVSTLGDIQKSSGKFALGASTLAHDFRGPFQLNHFVVFTSPCPLLIPAK